MFDSMQQEPEPHNVDGNTMIAVTMSAMHWAIITDGIKKLPFEVAAPLLQEMTRQLMIATRPVPPKTE